MDWDPKEKAYLRRCFQFWNGFTGGIEPEIPDGISYAKAQILKFKAKTMSELTQRRKRMENLKTISLKVTDDFYSHVAHDSAEVDVNISLFIRACILLASSQIKANPKLINFFSESIIPR